MEATLSFLTMMTEDGVPYNQPKSPARYCSVSGKTTLVGIAIKIFISNFYQMILRPIFLFPLLVYWCRVNVVVNIQIKLKTKNVSYKDN